MQEWFLYLDYEVIQHRCVLLENSQTYIIGPFMGGHEVTGQFQEIIISTVTIFVISC